MVRRPRSSAHSPKKMKLQLTLLCTSLLVSSTLFAQESGQETSQENKETTNKNEQQVAVIISDMKNPALKPYRVMAAGMEAYEENRALAPNAPLFFKLNRRSGTKVVPWQEIKMRLASDDESKQIPILENGRFALEKNEKAYEENAELILNQAKSNYSFRADIRTSGLEPHRYRMGDMHLGCKMDVDMAKKELGFILSSLVSTFLMKIDWCESKYELFSVPLNDWAINMKTIHGEQVSTQEFRGNFFKPAFWNKEISPDTVYEFKLWSSLDKAAQQEVIDQQNFVIRHTNKKNPAAVPLIKDQQRYYADISITEARFDFQIGADKGVLAFASVERQMEIKPDQKTPLKLGTANQYLKAPQNGTYRFTLDLSDVDHPHFHISRISDLVPAT